MRITTLVENVVHKPKLIAEHGLSFLIETGQETILFDTGQGYSLKHNCEVMGVDLSRVQKVILSHGHYDHTGGLEIVLSASEGVQIYAHPDVFDNKYSKDNQGQRFIGIPTSKERIGSSGAKLFLSREPIRVAENVRTTGEIKRQTEFESISERFCVMRNGILETDSLMDDLALVINNECGVTVIFGCAHSGVINTLMHVRQMTGEAPINLIVGGFHLVDASDERIHKTIEFLKKFNIKKLAPCHCTGIDAIMRLKTTFDDRLIPFNVGSEIEI